MKIKENKVVYLGKDDIINGTLIIPEGVRNFSHDCLIETGIECDEIVFPSTFDALNSESKIFDVKAETLTFSEGIKKVRIVVKNNSLKVVNLPKSLNFANIFSLTTNPVAGAEINYWLTSTEQQKEEFNGVNDFDLQKINENITSIACNGKSFVIENGTDVYEYTEKDIEKLKDTTTILAAHNIYKWHLMKKYFENNYSGEMKILPSSEEVVLMPTDKYQEYFKNRKLFREITDKTEHYLFAERAGIIDLAIRMGLLEQDSGVKNAAITFIRENILSEKKIDIASFHAYDSFYMQDMVCEYNPKLHNLIQDIFKTAEPVTVKLICGAIKNFDELVKIIRNPKYKDLKNFTYENEYAVKSKEHERLAKLSAGFQLRKTEFNEVLELSNHAKQSKIKNFIDLVNAKTGKLKQKHADVANQILKEGGKDFNFEWLQKDDEINAFLGYICDCCMKIDGVGKHILQASYLQDNVQTLAVRDKNGSIIAKTTAIFDINNALVYLNTMEVNKNFTNKASFETKQKVLNAFLRGINKMIESYNKQTIGTKIKPINKVINTGVYSDLLMQLQKSFERDDAEYNVVEFMGKKMDSEMVKIYKLYDSGVDFDGITIEDEIETKMM